MWNIVTMELFKNNFSVGRLIYLFNTPYERLKPFEAKIVWTVTQAIKGFFLYGALMPFFTLPWLYTTCEKWTLEEILIATWSISEILFHMYKQTRVSIIRNRATGQLTHSERMHMCHKLLEHIEQPISTLRSWYLKPMPPKPHASHFREWIIWLFFKKPGCQLNPKEHQETFAILKAFDDKMKTGGNYRHFEEDEGVPCMRPGLDHMVPFHKPLVFSAVLSFYRTFSAYTLKYFGFCAGQLNRNSKVKYQVFNDSGEGAPIVMLIGAGIGYFPYLLEVWRMQKHHPDRKILLLEVPFLEMGTVSEVTTTEEIVEEISELFVRTGLEPGAWLAHDHGTLIMTQIIKNRPGLIGSLTLVDPICFRTWDATLAKRALYATPTSMAQDFLQTFVVRDPILANAIVSKYSWYNSLLFIEELKEIPTHIFLSQKDYVIDAGACYRYLNKRLAAHPQDNIHIKLVCGFRGSSLYSPHTVNQVLETL